MLQSGRSGCSQAIMDCVCWRDTERRGYALLLKGIPVNTFESTRLGLKIGFAVAAVLLPIVLPFLAPHIGIREGGNIPLSGLQVLYAVLSVELAVAVYVWGVGNWSRFEPPRISPATPAVPTSGPAQTARLGPTPPAAINAGPAAPTSGTPSALQGGH
jgi:hypothetical protein